MNSTDDVLIREVDEDLRRERWARLWKRYGGIIVGAAVAIVLAVAGYEAWRGYRQGLREDAGRRFAAAEAIAPRDAAGAADAFAAIAADAPAGHALLARLLEARSRTAAGDVAAARRLYERIAAEERDATYRDLAVLMAAITTLARPGEIIADPDALRARLEPLSAADNPWRFSAREALAMLALDAGDRARARQILVGLGEDAAAPAELRLRAERLAAQLGEG